MRVVLSAAIMLVTNYFKLIKNSKLTERIAMLGKVQTGLFSIVFFLLSCCANAEEPQKFSPTKSNIVYAGENSADNPRKLDLYLPIKTKQGFPVLIWFHGGGLVSGSKNQLNDQRIAEYWRTRGVGLVNVDYRMSPQVQFPAYIQDAAQAVAWVMQNAKKLGADPRRIYVGGHSAGAYLAAMLAFDENYLKQNAVDVNSIAGFVSLSGQMTTHFTVRKERGLSDLLIIVDDAAPSHYVRKEIPHLLLLIGDHDWPARLEENQMLFAQLTQVAKATNVNFKVISNRDHNSIYDRITEPKDETYEAIATFMNLPH